MLFSEIPPCSSTLDDALLPHMQRGQVSHRRVFVALALRLGIQRGKAHSIVRTSTLRTDRRTYVKLAGMRSVSETTLLPHRAAA